MESFQLSTCDYTVRRRGVRGADRTTITLDTAPNPTQRFDDHLAERQQFTEQDPDFRPHSLSGVGGGAYWVGGLDELFAYSERRLVTVTYVPARAGDDRRARGIAVRLARRALGGS